MSSISQCSVPRQPEQLFFMVMTINEISNAAAFALPSDVSFLNNLSFWVLGKSSIAFTPFSFQLQFILLLLLLVAFSFTHIFGIYLTTFHWITGFRWVTLYQLNRSAVSMILLNSKYFGGIWKLTFDLLLNFAPTLMLLPQLKTTVCATIIKPYMIVGTAILSFNPGLIYRVLWE